MTGQINTDHIEGGDDTPVTVSFTFDLINNPDNPNDTLKVTMSAQSTKQWAQRDCEALIAAVMVLAGVGAVSDVDGLDAEVKAFLDSADAADGAYAN